MNITWGRVLLLLALVTGGIRVFAQEQHTPSITVEDRVTALEKRIRALEAKRGVTGAEINSAVSVEERIAALEQRLTDLDSRADMQVASVSQTPVPPAQTPNQGSAVFSVTPAAASESDQMFTPPYAGYMETHLNGARGEPTLFDFHRFVMVFGHSFSPRLKFWSELEIEHAFIEGRERGGEISLEQAFLDMYLRPEISLRGGILLAPVGIVNERHEPPSFFGVERPFVDTVIIPSTWFDAGFGIYGDLGRGFNYKLYAMAPPDATRFSADEGIRGGRQRALFSVVNSPGVTGRLEYRGIRRLTLGTSFFSGNTGFQLRDLDPRLNLFEFDGRYRYRRAEFRGEFAQYWLSRTGELNRTLEQQTGVNPNIGKSALGYYLEAAYHLLPPETGGDVAPFFRYERFNTQHRMADSFAPFPQFDRTASTLGLTYRPHPDVALKLDYQFLRNRSDVFPIFNRVNAGIGWWF